MNVKKDEEKLIIFGDVEEGKGKIPLWLIVSYIVLVSWAVYYMIRFWGGSGPGAGLN